MNRCIYNFSLLEAILFSSHKVQLILSYDNKNLTKELFEGFVNKIFDL